MKADEYTCDGCGKIKLARADDISEVFGYHGTVMHIHNGGGSGNVDWFACRETCIPTAVLTSLQRNDLE